MARYRGVRVRQGLSRSGLSDLDYALNPYIGCEHGCLYCYARSYTRYRIVAENWGEIVYFKENVCSLVEREARRLRPGIVGVSTITDPYQPLEERKALTRKCIQILLAHDFKVSIQTKSPLVLRDLDLLSRDRSKIDVGFTIITVDDEKASIVEPGAPPPSSRVEALRLLSDHGLKTWVFLGPVIPGFNDDEDSIRRVVDVAADTGSVLYYDFLRVKPGLQALEKVLPDALHRSRSIAWRRLVEKTIIKECEKRGVECESEY